jgi:restriction system protein
VVPRVGTVANVATRGSSARGGACLLAAGRTGCRAFELPSVEVIPAVDSYTYVATTSTLREKKRPKAEIAQLYRSVVSQITLLYMRDLFESDSELENVELAGHVRSVNRATGQWEYPCLISVATDRATYSTLNLHDAHPDVCLHRLSALVSHHPHLVEAVTPIRDFDLARYSFVENVDVVAGLDSRADLTKMSPTEFEHFVRQLFEASGLEGWTTQRSGDDGVDAGHQPRPSGWWPHDRPSEEVSGGYWCKSRS